MVAVAAGVLPSVAIAVSRSAAEADAFNSVYHAASLSGRDANAAVRKAHFRTELLVKEFGMTRSDAAVEVARNMILRVGGLCGGG
jgi:hypothetical protein